MNSPQAACRHTVTAPTPPSRLLPPRVCMHAHACVLHTSAATRPMLHDLIFLFPTSYASVLASCSRGLCGHDNFVGVQRLEKQRDTRHERTQVVFEWACFGCGWSPAVAQWSCQMSTQHMSGSPCTRIKLTRCVTMLSV